MSEIMESAPEVEVSEVESNEEIIESEGEEYESDDSGSSEELTEEQSEELSEEIDEAIEEGASPEEVRELIKEYKIKVNGKEKTVKIDLNNEADIIRRLQMAEAGQGAMQKSSELEKAFNDFINQVKGDPEYLFKELGLNKQEWVEKQLEKEIEQLKKSPEQIKQEEMERELEDLRSKIKKEEETRKQAEFEKAQRESEIELENDIIEAIDSITELPKTPYVVRKIADTMAQAYDKGYTNVTAKQVAPFVEKNIKAELQEMMNMLPAESIRKMLGDDVANKLRQDRLKKIKKVPNKKVTEISKTRTKDEKPAKKISMKDFLRG